MTGARWAAQAMRRVTNAFCRAHNRPVTLGPFYDYDEAAWFTGYSPGYLKRLCDRRQLGYIVQTYYRGHKRRRVRRIPHAELEALMARRYVPSIHSNHRERLG